MNPQFTLLRALRAAAVAPEAPPRTLDDASAAFREVTRAAVLGEPGEGKATTRFKIAGDLVEAALADPGAPVPLRARLRDWTDADESLTRFLARRLDVAEPVLDGMPHCGTVVLLLDGVNEIPAEQRAEKATQVRELLEKRPKPRVLVSCRQLDHRGDLALDTLTIRPLDPERIREFVVRTSRWPCRRRRRTRASARRGEGNGRRTCSGSSPGGADVRALFETWERARADLATFFSAPGIPRDISAKTSYAEDDLWCEKVRDDPRSLVRMAANPYLLAMLVEVYDPETGRLPDNRAALFERFVAVLLARERLAIHEETEDRVVVSEDGRPLLAGLERLAWAMQTGASGAAGEARQALPRREAEPGVTSCAWRSSRQSARAASSNPSWGRTTWSRATPRSSGRFPLRASRRVVPMNPMNG